MKPLKDADNTLSVPRHIGLILDGNRRWARANGLPILQGHRKGYENLKTIVEAAHERGVTYVSAFVFSTENWNRSTEEVDYLMKLLMWVVTDELKEMHNKGVKVLWLGSKQNMLPDLIKKIEAAEELTKDNMTGTLALCLNHGGHREIAEAVERMVRSGVTADEITEELIAQHIDSPELPPIDLVIRTSGEQRLSNFMLWRAAYSELIFRNEQWPDFTVDSLDECLVEYSKRQRRFGG